MFNENKRIRIESGRTRAGDEFFLQLTLYFRNALTSFMIPIQTISARREAYLVLNLMTKWRLRRPGAGGDLDQVHRWFVCQCRGVAGM